jgi:hypothetical protein
LYGMTLSVPDIRKKIEYKKIWHKKIEQKKKKVS